MKKLLFMNRLSFIWIAVLLVACMPAIAQSVKKSVFLYAGQSNADGREYVQNLPEYMKVGTAPYAPYTYCFYRKSSAFPAHYPLHP